MALDDRVEQFWTSYHAVSLGSQSGEEELRVFLKRRLWQNCEFQIAQAGRPLVIRNELVVVSMQVFVIHSLIPAVLS